MRFRVAVGLGIKDDMGMGLSSSTATEASPIPDFMVFGLDQMSGECPKCLDESQSITHIHIPGFISCES